MTRPGQERLRAELITGYLPVARHIARNHRYRGENLDDLEQVATVGLINAVDRFDVDRGLDFLAFAIPTINGEVLRHQRPSSGFPRCTCPGCSWSAWATCAPGSPSTTRTATGE